MSDRTFGKTVTQNKKYYAQKKAFTAIEVIYQEINCWVFTNTT